MSQRTWLIWQDGQACKNPVNKSSCAYCEYHVQAELKRMSTTRAQLRGHSLKSALRNSKSSKLASESLGSACINRVGMYLMHLIYQHIDCILLLIRSLSSAIIFQQELHYQIKQGIRLSGLFCPPGPPGLRLEKNSTQISSLEHLSQRRRFLRPI